MPDPTLLLVGLSAREVAARAELLALAAEVGAGTAYLQMGDPVLGRELTRLADAGVAEIELVGVSLGRLAPGASWLRRVADDWWRRRGGEGPVVSTAPRLLGTLQVDDLAAARRGVVPVTGSGPGLRSAAWDRASAHRQQVLVCRGPRCSARGADASLEAMVVALVEAGCTDDDVLVTHTGCLLPCDEGPVVVVHPDDAWYARVLPEVALRVVGEHLLAGRALPEHRLPGRPCPPGSVPG